MPKLSVIVPVYNVENYIKRCLDSLVNQTLNDIEIIVINDGSPDDSEKIILEYQNKNPDKLRYYKKENGGLSDAKNFGVLKANGEYITFIDSDDYVEKNLFEALEKYIDLKNDLIKYKMVIIREKQEIQVEKVKTTGATFDTISGEEAFERLSISDKYMDSSCIYLYKREFYMNHNFQFTKGLYHEDFGLTPLIIANANTVVSTNIYGYYYVERKDSITQTKNHDIIIKKARDLIIHYDKMIKELERNNEITLKSKNKLKEYYTNAIILKTKELKREDRKQYIKEIKKRKLLRNLKVRNLKQFLKKLLLMIDIRLFLKLK